MSRDHVVKQMLDRIERKIDRIVKQEHIQTIQGEIQMATIDEVLSHVEEMDDVNDSLDAVFAKLQELIAAGSADPAKLQQALAIITTQKERTKAAILANTPVAPPEPGV